MDDSQVISIGFKYTVLPDKCSRRDVPVKSNSFGHLLSAGGIYGVVRFYKDHEFSSNIDMVDCLEIILWNGNLRLKMVEEGCVKGRAEDLYIAFFPCYTIRIQKMISNSTWYDSHCLKAKLMHSIQGLYDLRRPWIAQFNLHRKCIGNCSCMFVCSHTLALQGPILLSLGCHCDSVWAMYD